MNFIEEADSKHKDVGYESIKLYHGSYESSMYYTVAVMLSTNVYHVGLARLNLAGGDQYSRPKGRKISVGRLLFQAAVFRNVARRRLKFVLTEQGPVVDESKPCNAVTIPIGYSTPEDLAIIASKMLQVPVPDFMFKQHIQFKKPDHVETPNV